MAMGGVLFGLVLLIAIGSPIAAAWPYIAASSIIHLVYWTALYRGYSTGDMSHVYTIARGSAPMLVTVAAIPFAQEVPTPQAAVGIALISLGVFAIGVSPKAPVKATGWAALTGISIAAYSLIDALGVRIAGDVLAYKSWGMIGTFLPILFFVLVRRTPAGFLEAGQGRWARGLFAGVISSAGFAIVLWAQMRAPIGPVTALRELSVAFGAAIAAVVLKEMVTPRRWTGAIMVAAGAMLIGFSS
jgi:drug/metabolite transporter (DMT)-like permease